MPKKVINVKDISREEWLEIRRNSIGGSDSAAACGMSPWKSQLELWCDKMGMIPDKETNETMRRGTYLEEYVAERFAEETGKKVIRSNFMYADDDFPCLTANIDRMIVGEKAGLECKTMNDFSTGDYDIENGEIPTQYYYQVQHYMMVMGWEYMYIAFSSNFKFTWLKVDRNDDFIKDMRQKELDFWYNHVIKKVRPESDGSDSAMEALVRLYPNETPDSVIHFDFEALGKRYIELNDLANRVKAEKDEIKGKICDTMQDAELGLSDNYKASWKTQSKNSFDTKRFKADYPELYNNYTTVNSSRVFRLNQIKRKEESK
jgi:putative phage-type endonuclease